MKSCTKGIELELHVGDGFVNNRIGRVIWSLCQMLTVLSFMELADVRVVESGKFVVKMFEDAVSGV